MYLLAYVYFKDPIFNGKLHLNLLNRAFFKISPVADKEFQKCKLFKVEYFFLPFRIDDFYTCQPENGTEFCLKESWSVPLQLELAYLRILKKLTARKEFCEFWRI
jgi:hypothetical protein